MFVSSKGRTFHSGKSLNSDMRTAVVDHIMKEGGDLLTGYFPGSLSKVAEHFKLSRTAVKKIWMQCCETADIDAKWKGGNNPPHLQSHHLDFIEGLKTMKPSMAYSKIYDAVNMHCNIPSGTSKSSIGKAVQYRLPGGQWTWKKMSRANGEKFIPANTNYCQDFLNFMSAVDPVRLKFFDEAGFRLPDVGKPNYGHSLVNTHCVEIGRYLNTPNVTLNLLMGLEGVLYANTEDGASDTLTFLNFWGEASQSKMPSGLPILHYGDIVVLDNCATHHNRGGYVLAEWLNELGVDVVYLPVYSPELNPCELVFNKLKTLAKRTEIRAVFNRDIHDGIYECLQNVTEYDCAGFFKHADYINF